MMKKIFATLLIIILIMTSLVSLTACDGGLSGLLPDNNQSNGNENDTDDVLIVNPDNNTNGGDDAADTPDNGDDDEPIIDDETNNGNDDKPVVEDDFEDYGMNVITIELTQVNVNENGKYNTLEEVGAYLNEYHKLPSNYNKSSSYVKKNTSENKLSYTGGTFQNREGLLPKATGRTFTECDIAYCGGARNALRIVFSSDFLIFYTDDHYKSFSILRFV